jgi:carboxypeptidase C (cathepsin A)
MQPDLSFGLYAGYADIPHTRKQMYYVAALSKNNASVDPVIVWLSGSPGCSSLIGYALEHGPYVIEDESYSFSANPYSWNNNATVIYLDAPAGVGFSVCGDQSECNNFDDSNTAEDNL